MTTGRRFLWQTRCFARSFKKASLFAPKMLGRKLAHPPNQTSTPKVLVALVLRTEHELAGSGEVAAGSQLEGLVLWIQHGLTLKMGVHEVKTTPSGRRLYMHTNMFIYICVFMCIYIYIYAYNCFFFICVPLWNPQDGLRSVPVGFMLCRT